MYGMLNDDGFLIGSLSIGERECEVQCCLLIYFRTVKLQLYCVWWHFCSFCWKENLTFSPVFIWWRLWKVRSATVDWFPKPISRYLIYAICRQQRAQRSLLQSSLPPAMIRTRIFFSLEYCCHPLRHVAKRLWHDSSKSLLSCFVYLGFCN